VYLKRYLRNLEENMVQGLPSVQRSTSVSVCASTGRPLLYAALLTLVGPNTLWAQDPGTAIPDEDAVDEIEEIIVTGSRLRRRDFSAPSPIATIDREALEFSGQTTLETTLNQMPQVTPDYDRTANNPGNGTARINLRGLGSHRTLVMLNGRRLAPSGIGTAVDVNNLPQALIERVEVITGGATTVYGSDAVAGVVNFITRNDFEGFSLDLSRHWTEEGDSNIYDVSVAYGHKFSSGRGNITLFGGYYDREETYADARELTSVRWWDPWWDPTAAGELMQGGSSRVPEGAILFPEVDFGNGPAWTIFNADGNPREYLSPDDDYNWAPWNFLQVPLERYSGGVLLNYDLTSRRELYIEVAHTHSEVRRVLAPIPGGGWLEFNTDNPVMTPATQQFFADNMIPQGGNLVLALTRKRFEELGSRIIENNTDYTRVVAGLKGDVWTDWEFDAWVTYTNSDESEFFFNDGSRSRFQQGLLVDPLTGQCFDPSNGCVPINMFGLGNMSAEAIDFLRIPRMENVTSREQILASAYVRGKLFDTWAGGVETALGVEWRRDDGSFKADDYLFSGDTLGYGGDSPVNGKEDVVEVYAEMLIPLADGVTFVDYLALEIGGRYSDYDHAGSVDTYKMGLEWRPIAGFGFRGMYQRSVRAPNLEEAFQEQSVYEGSFVVEVGDDPCSASSDPAAAGNVEKCIATGLPSEQIGVFEAFEFPTLYYWGGNPDLEPETADTLTLGIVIAPDSIPNLQLAVDYFDLQVDGGIGGLDAAGACFDSANVNNLFCDRIGRDAITFNVDEVRENNINRGQFKTTGVDTQISYAIDLPAALAIGGNGADVSVNVIWTHLKELLSQGTVYSTPLDCAGYFGAPCDGDNEGGMTFPTDRVTTSLSYASGDLSARLSWRWIDQTDNGAPFYTPDWGVPDPDLAVPYVEQKNYLDLGVAYKFNDHLVARLTVANLTDTDAPMMADAVWDKNTDTRMYDIFGRSYTLSFSLVY
jgi:outer membrane receptor protein involved in Fe transport